MIKQPLLESCGCFDVCDLVIPCILYLGYLKYFFLKFLQDFHIICV